MSEWDEKPECYGKLTRDKLESCQTCGHQYECSGLTMVANFADLNKLKPPMEVPAMTFCGVIKPPKLSDLAKKCREAYDALIEQKFTPDQAMELTHLLGRFF